MPTTRGAFMRQYAGLAPVFDEGAAWMYSNTNYILLGFIIAALSGVSYAEAAQTLFARVGGAGITVGSPHWARAAKSADLGPDARDQESWAREVIGDGDISAMLGGAAAWMDALLDPKRIPSEAFAPTVLSNGPRAAYANQAPTYGRCYMGKGGAN